MALALIRVDERLVHGQVIEAWVPHLKARRLVVVDAEAAASPLTRMAMGMALPPGISLEIVPPGTTGWETDPAPTLVLVRTLGEAARLVAGPAAGVRVNVGVVQHQPGRRAIVPGVHLSADEVEHLASLDAQGVPVEVRTLPAHPALGLAEVRSRFEKGGDR